MIDAAELFHLRKLAEADGGDMAHNVLALLDELEKAQGKKTRPRERWVDPAFKASPAAVVPEAVNIEDDSDLINEVGLMFFDAMTDVEDMLKNQIVAGCVLD